MTEDEAELQRLVTARRLREERDAATEQWILDRLRGRRPPLGSPRAQVVSRDELARRLQPGHDVLMPDGRYVRFDTEAEALDAQAQAFATYYGADYGRPLKAGR